VGRGCGRRRCRTAGQSPSADRRAEGVRLRGRGAGVLRQTRAHVGRRASAEHGAGGRCQHQRTGGRAGAAAVVAAAGVGRRRRRWVGGRWRLRGRGGMAVGRGRLRDMRMSGGGLRAVGGSDGCGVRVVHRAVRRLRSRRAVHAVRSPSRPLRRPGVGSMCGQRRRRCRIPALRMRAPAPRAAHRRRGRADGVERQQQAQQDAEQWAEERGSHRRKCTALGREGAERGCNAGGNTACMPPDAAGSPRRGSILVGGHMRRLAHGRGVRSRCRLQPALGGRSRPGSSWRFFPWARFPIIARHMAVRARCLTLPPG